MYFTRILLTVLILVPLSLAATTTLRTTTVKASKTTAASSKGKATTSKEGISLRLGENNSNRGAGSGKVITTRLSPNGNPEEQCQCVQFYLCDQADVVTVESGNAEQCTESSTVCCRLPIAWTTPDTPSLPVNPDDQQNVGPQPNTGQQPNIDPQPPIGIDPNQGVDPQPQQPPIENGGLPQSTCICVTASQCTDPLVVSAGAGLIDPRFSCVSPDICCPSESISQGVTGYTPTMAPPYEPTPSPQPPYIDPNPNPNQNPNPVFPPTTGTTTPGECGIRYPSTTNRISAPEHLAQTTFGEFPWMALILTSETNLDGTRTDNVFVCGASLLSSTIVLTAAHCVYNKLPETLRIRAGEYNTHAGTSEPLLHQDRQVERISVHNEFNHRVLFNDVALIRVSEPFDFAPHVNPICSPVINTQFENPSSYDPTNCLATGWGRNAFHTGDFQVTLKRVDLTLIDQNTCENRLRQTKLGGQFNLHSSFICAGGQPGFDTCQGDGGGPLVCASLENRNKYIQVGIISWGIGCASDIPGVYASVYALREWLNLEYNSLNVFRIGETSSRIGGSSSSSNTKPGSNSKPTSASKPNSNSKPSTSSKGGASPKLGSNTKVSSNSTRS